VHRQDAKGKGRGREEICKIYGKYTYANTRYNINRMVVWAKGGEYLLSKRIKSVLASKSLFP